MSKELTTRLMAYSMAWLVLSLMAVSPLFIGTAAAQATRSCSVNRQSGSPGTTFELTFRGFEPNTAIEIFEVYNDGNERKISNVAFTDSSGQANFGIIKNDAGSYKIIGRDSGGGADCSFSVVQDTVGTITVSVSGLRANTASRITLATAVQGVIRMELNILPPSGQIINLALSQFQNTWVASYTPSEAGTYSYSARAYDSNNQVIATGSGQFQVTAGSQTLPTINCEQCKERGGKFCVKRNVNNYPDLKCVLNSNCPEDYTEQNTCSNLLCEEVCTYRAYTQFYRSGGVPMGYCSEENPIAISAYIKQQTGTTQIIYGPDFIQREGLCPGAQERCYCTILGVASASYSQSTYTVPGTSNTEHWPPSSNYYVNANDIPKIPPNDVDCTQTSNVTVRAGINGTDTLQVVAAGQQVTLEGEVGRFSNVCNGYKFTCQAFKEYGCKYEKKTFSESLSYVKCPEQLPERIAAEGEYDETCISCILRPILTIAGVVASVAFGAPPQLAGSIAAALSNAAVAIDNPDCVDWLAMVLATGIALASLPEGADTGAGASPTPAAPLAPPGREISKGYEIDVSSQPNDRFVQTVPLALLTGQFIGVAHAQSNGQPCGPSNSGVCTDITTGVNTGGYFTRWYCADTPLTNQCKFPASITNCQSCVSDNKKWCYTSNSGYCASVTGPASPSTYPGVNQNCLDGYEEIHANDVSSCESIVPVTAGGTATRGTGTVSTSGCSVTPTSAAYGTTFYVNCAGISYPNILRVRVIDSNGAEVYSTQSQVVTSGEAARLTQSAYQKVGTFTVKVSNDFNPGNVIGEAGFTVNGKWYICGNENVCKEAASGEAACGIPVNYLEFSTRSQCEAALSAGADATKGQQCQAAGGMCVTSSICSTIYRMDAQNDCGSGQFGYPLYCYNRNCVQLSQQSGQTQTSSGCSISITTNSVLPSGRINQPYSTKLEASGSGCSLPYSWSLASGTLPQGLTISWDGTISGTPASAGTYSNIVFRVQDTKGTATTKTFSLTINDLQQQSQRQTTGRAMTPDEAAAVAGQTLSNAEQKTSWNWKAGGQALMTAIALSRSKPSCSILDNNVDVCYSVCAKTYDTKISASPVCNAGGNILRYSSAKYSCNPRLCGGYPNHEVTINIKHGPTIIMTDIATTDENGKFSYTFTAPDLNDVITIELTTEV